MKRILAIILAIIMGISLCACGKGQKAEKYCFNCGEGISKSVSFCEHCGANVKENSVENSSSTSTASTPSSNTSTTSTPSSNKPTASSKPSTSTTTSSKPTTPAHTHSYSKKITAATCTAQGYTTYTCSCGHTYKDNYINPSHSYSNYVCSKCGEVDKDNAYEHLINWVLKNGKTSGSTIAYNYNSDMIFSISYNTQGDYLYICQYGYVNDSFFYASINLNSWFFGVSLEETELTGFFNHEKFTDTYPLSYQQYDGPASSKNDFIELSRIALVELIDWFEWTLKDKEIGITLKDVGFLAY